MARITWRVAVTLFYMHQLSASKQRRSGSVCHSAHSGECGDGYACDVAINVCISCSAICTPEAYTHRDGSIRYSKSRACTQHCPDYPVTLPGEARQRVAATVSTSPWPTPDQQEARDEANGLQKNAADVTASDCSDQIIIHLIFEMALVLIIFLLTMLYLCILYNYHKLQRKMTSSQAVTSSSIAADERKRLKADEAASTA